MLPRTKRVTTKLFKDILDRSQSFYGNSFSLRLRKTTSLCDSRFSVYVPKKVFKSAVARNRQKRRINAILSELYPRIKPSFVGVFFAKALISETSPTALKEEIIFQLKKASLL